MEIKAALQANTFSNNFVTTTTSLPLKANGSGDSANNAIVLSDDDDDQ
jgi:hypothetical protein